MGNAAVVRTSPRVALPPGAATIGVGPEWCVATYRNIMLMHVSGQIDGEFLDASLAGHHAALAVDSSGYGVITICEPGAKIPPGELRDRALLLRKTTQHQLRAQAVLLGSDGFFASAMRGVITGILSLAQSRVPLAMVGSDVEAADFIVRRACSASTRTEDVVEVIASVRAGARR
jgi:hypothetical protein